jgi:hypothetical protein
VDIRGIKIIKTGAGPNLVLLHTLRTQLDLFEKVVVPSQLSVVARPHEDGLMRCWRAEFLVPSHGTIPELPDAAKRFCASERTI